MGSPVWVFAPHRTRELYNKHQHLHHMLLLLFGVEEGTLQSHSDAWVVHVLVALGRPCCACTTGCAQTIARQTRTLDSSASAFMDCLSARSSACADVSHASAFSVL